MPASPDRAPVVDVGDKLRRYSGYVESTRASWRPLRDAGDRHLDNLSRQERKERQAHCSVAPCVRGGSTVLLVEPLGRSRGGCLLLLTWFLSEPCLPDTCDRQASLRHHRAAASPSPAREPSSDVTETRGSRCAYLVQVTGCPRRGLNSSTAPVCALPSYSFTRYTSELGAKMRNMHMRCAVRTTLTP